MGIYLARANIWRIGGAVCVGKCALCVGLARNRLGFWPRALNREYEWGTESEKNGAAEAAIVLAVVVVVVVVVVEVIVEAPFCVNQIPARSLDLNVRTVLIFD